MAADFPSTLVDFADISCPSSVRPADRVNEIQEELEAIQVKIGVDNSAVATSLDYLVKSASSSNPGHKHTLANGATDVSASAAELNVLDGATAGTAVASKGVVLDSSKDFNFGTGDISATNISSTGTLTIAEVAGSWDGWTQSGETWTYASADDPTYTFTISGDKTSKYYKGMKVKCTNNATTFYGIISKTPTFAAGDTTVTVYGGTDYDLTSSAITAPYYSMMKSPAGFPLSTSKWSVVVTDTSDRSQVTPTTGTFYNLNSTSVSIPIGMWTVRCHITSHFDAGSASTSAVVDVALSTSNNSVSDSELRSRIRVVGASSTPSVGGTHHFEKFLELAAKTTYYAVIAQTSGISTGTLYFNNGISPLRVEVICALI
jgi:hypothetical protein